MDIKLNFNGTDYLVDLSKPIDISIPLQSGSNNPKCFDAPDPLFEPVRVEGFIGDTNLGGAVNFFNVHMNPHGNGTHTESVGHIAKEKYTLHDCLKTFHSIGVLVTVTPENIGADLVITKKMLETAILKTGSTAIQTLLVRTLPNNSNKLSQNYTATNPAYFSGEAIEFIVNTGIEHLIVDLPSIDKEKDDGKMAAHHIFWQYPHATRLNATITEMVFIASGIVDGFYFINIQIAPIVLDASSSKIIMFDLKKC